MKTLSSRQWLGVLWVAYAGLPAILLGLMLGVTALIWPGENPSLAISSHPAIMVLPIIAQFSVPVLAVIFAGWAMLKPLRAMSAAAGKVGKHDLNFALPTSRVREVNEALTAFTAMSEELRMALARQAELEQERQFYISAIAHDLNSPIFALRGYLEGLESGIAATPERAQRYIQVCQAKVSELERLTADLSAYTQIERLEQTLHHEPYDLGALLRDAVDGIQPQASAKGLTATLSPLEGDCACVGDPRLLARAITNLLENAVRYTPAGGKINVAWSAEGGQWRLTIADSGPGIAPEDLPHIFAPFYRGEASRNRATGGTGLGLAIAQRIFRAHGGDLTAANSPDGGAVFTATALVTA